MSGYIFQEFVKDFSGRTRQNLKVIEAIYNEHGDEPAKKVYEVTQMINCLFGMVIVPYEKYKNQVTESDYYDDPNYKEIRNIIKELERGAGKTKFIRSTYSEDSKGVGVFSFIRHLRNALAHSGNGRLNFYPINNNKDNIKAVYFMDKYENKYGHVSYFCCRLSLKRIRRLCESIPALYEALEKKIPEDERYRLYNEHINQISHLNGFLEGDDETEMEGVFE